MKKSTLFDAFYKNAGYFAVMLVSLAYIGSSFIIISKTGKSALEIIASGVISMTVGLLINGVFRSMGVSRGECDEKTLQTAKLYSQSIDEISPYFDRLEEFCERENKRETKRVRCQILASGGLRYSDFYDEDGIVTSYNCELYGDSEIAEAKGRRRRQMKRTNRKRKRAFERAAKIKIKQLTPSVLTCEGVKENNPFDFGKSKREYSSQKNLSDAIGRIVMAVIFGYFGVSLVSEVNPAVLIWNTLQIVMYVSSGILQMYSSYFWVVDEHRAGVIKKIDYLQKFKVYAQSAALYLTEA
ncbi:MAG: hypothetical protein IJC80_00320 [Clostridia bacterium]|nr:hypothetical protein [Clostridia bacterium]